MVFQKMRSQMKVVLIIIVVAFAVSLLYVGGSGLFAGGGGRPAHVAKVNGKAISYRDFQEAYLSNLRFYEQYQGRLSRSDGEQVRFQTLQQLINQQLMLQEARKNRIKVDKKDIDAEIQKIRENFVTEEEFKAALKQNNLTEAKLRELVRDNLAISELQQLKSQFTVTEEDVKRAYEQVRASHILIEPLGEQKDFELARIQAQKILEEIQSGKITFADAAKKYSADNASKANGGDLDFFGRNSGFVPEFVEAAFALGVGEISAPVKTAYGYHLIKVTAKKEAAGEEFENQKEALQHQLEQEGASRAFNEWFTRVRSEARVDVTDPALRAMQFLVNGQLPQAVAQYQEAIKSDPNDPYLHLALGNVYQQLGDSDRALDEYKAAANFGSNDPEIYLTLGLAYRQKEMTEEAAEQFRKASELDPLDFQLHLTLLQLFTAMGLPEDAKAEEAKLTEIQRQVEEARKAAEEQAKAREELEKRLAAEE
jgi:parvulin-like peptidyl-prolyl isomerase